MKSPEIPNLPISHMFNGDIWLELQALVAARLRNCNLFFGSEFFAQRFNRPLTIWPNKIFGHPNHVFGQISKTANGKIWKLRILHKHIMYESNN